MPFTHLGEQSIRHKGLHGLALFDGVVHYNGAFVRFACPSQTLESKVSGTGTKDCMVLRFLMV